VIKTTNPKNGGLRKLGGRRAHARDDAQGKTGRNPLPGAIAPGTPMSDVTKVGDSFVTNAMLDNVLVSPDGFCDAGTKVYAKGHDLKDPLPRRFTVTSRGFPPTILTSGTRDRYSTTRCAYARKRQAGVEAHLQVFEGSRAARPVRSGTCSPETREAFEEIARSSTSTWAGDRGASFYTSRVRPPLSSNSR
jgi:acetyl esterase/lipase